MSTDAEIVLKYGLTFLMKNVDSRVYRVCRTSIAQNQILAEFLVCSEQTNEAVEILAAVESVLDQTFQNEYYDAIDINVEIEYQNTHFYYDDNPNGVNSPELTLPTEEFKSIMAEWKYFLANTDHLNQ